MSHSASPSLDTDDRVAFIENTELDRVHDAPLQTAINIFLPWRVVKVWLSFWKVEGIDTAVQMGVLSMSVYRIHAICGRHTREAIALRLTMMIGHTGRYLETRRAVVPL